MPGQCRLLLPLMSLLLLGAEGGALRGWLMLQKGHDRQAMDIFAAALERDPKNEAAQVGLGLALGGIGRCEEAMGRLNGKQASIAWDHRASLAAARCSVVLGRPAMATYYLEEAVAFDPDRVLVLVKAAWQALDAGDRESAATWSERIEALAPNSSSALLLSAHQSWFDGDHDRLFVVLMELRTQEGPLPWASLIEAWAWLDLDDPEAALNALDGAGGGQSRALMLLWMAEAHRRAGRPGRAIELLTAPRARVDEDPRRMAFLLRAQLDYRMDTDPTSTVADLEQAADALVAASPGTAEATITRWYINERSGRPDPALADAARAELRGMAQLEQLAPIDRR
jgi:tetratricopeptide (TPR) repeat protein